MNNLRIGQGIDFHRLVPNRPLVLGGVTIPFEKGLEGHSDADVILHALMDALLGAAGMEDIGHHFSNLEERWRGASSVKLLEIVANLLEKGGYGIVNIDCTLMAEVPKIRPYIEQMCKNIAESLGCERKFVNLKATTTEGLGFIGRGEGMMASAVVLLEYRGGENQ